MSFESKVAFEEMLYQIRKHRRILLHNHGKQALIEFNKLLEEHFIKQILLDIHLMKQTHS